MGTGMQSSVFLQNHSLAIEKILDQEGISFSGKLSVSEACAHGTRIFFLNRELDESFLALVTPCVFITQHNHLGPFLKIPVSRHEDSLLFSMPQQDIFSARSFFVGFPSYGLSSIPVYGWHSSLKDSSLPNSGIYLTNIHQHWIVSLPWDFEEWGHDMVYRPYYSSACKKHFYEIGPRVDWGPFRRLMRELLLFACRQTSTTLSIKKRFPADKRFFSVRIDADGYSRNSMKMCLEIASNKKLVFDWFIDVGSWAGNYSAVKELSESGHSVGLHDFYHMTYKKYEPNFWNMNKGKKFLIKACRLKLAGVVSPFGYYFPGYQEAIKDLGFLYSSEFGYDTDNLPSYPMNDQSFPLQIPVHPGSIGTLLNSGFQEGEIFEHLYETALRQSSLDGFVVLYDHPVGRLELYSQAYEDMLGQLLEEGIESISMNQISEIWNYPTKQALFEPCFSGGFKDEFVLPPEDIYIRNTSIYSVHRQTDDNLCQWFVRAHFSFYRSYFRSITWQLGL